MRSKQIFKLIKLMLINVFILLITSAGIYAADFRWGIKTGITVSEIRMKDMPAEHINVDKPEIWRHDFDPKIGCNISFAGGYDLNSNIYVGIEPGYILKGANFDASNAKLDLHYFNLPVILKYRFSERISIYAGPEFSKLFKATLKFNSSTINMNDFYSSKIETSLFLGTEYQITKNISLGLRYSYGLTTISETEWTDESGFLDSLCKENNYYTLVYLSWEIN